MSPIASTVPLEYRKALATHVATLGNTIVAHAFGWHQSQETDQSFENVLFNCAVEFNRLAQLYHNERLIHGMQQEVVSGAEEVLKFSPPKPPNLAPNDIDVPPSIESRSAEQDPPHTPEEDEERRENDDPNP